MRLYWTKSRPKAIEQCALSSTFPSHYKPSMSLLSFLIFCGWHIVRVQRSDLIFRSEIPKINFLERCYRERRGNKTSILNLFDHVSQRRYQKFVDFLWICVLDNDISIIDRLFE